VALGGVTDSKVWVGCLGGLAKVTKFSAGAVVVLAGCMMFFLGQELTAL